MLRFGSDAETVLLVEINSFLKDALKFLAMCTGTESYSFKPYCAQPSASAMDLSF
jgi:hypothetical protein